MTKMLQKLINAMKAYEKRLMNHLQEDTQSNLPLENVKKAMGSLRYMKGNPLTKTEISIQITTQFNQVGVGLIAPALLPVNLQTTLPVYLFSLTDYYGGFLRIRNVIPSGLGWVGNLALGFNGISGYNANLALAPFAYDVGDLVLSFSDGGAPPVYTATVIIHCNNISYGTFLNSFVSDLITINTLRCIVPIANINQFINPLKFGYQTLFGKTYFDDIDPRAYITSTDFQQQIADIPLHLPIDKNVLLGFSLSVFCQMFSTILFVEKVEPLTNKQK